MITTDVAARGIDIPLLDNVINYNFPAKAKLFVHRVGKKAPTFITFASLIPFLWTIFLDSLKGLTRLDIP